MTVRNQSIAKSAVLSGPATAFVEIPLAARVVIILLFFGLMVGIGLKDLVGTATVDTIKWVSLGLQLNLVLLVLPIIFYRSGWGWFHPIIFTVFLTVMEHVRQLSVYWSGLSQHTALPTWTATDLTSLVAYELLLSAVGLLVYYLGFFLMPNRGIPRLRLGQPQGLRLRLLAAIAFSLVVFAGYMVTRGGIIAHIRSWGAGRQAALSGQYYWQLAQEMGVVACLVWLGCDRKAHRQPLFWLSAVSVLMTAFLSSGSRSSVIYTIIYGVMVWALRERKLSLANIGLTIILGVFLLGLLGSFRNSTFSGEIGVNTGAENSNFSAGLTEISERGSVGRGSTAILARVPHDVGYLYGESYLALVTVPVPRALWPAKPGMVGGQVGKIFFGTTAGIPPGPIGESYWNFGIAGVLLLFFCYGAFHRWLAITFRAHAHQPAAFVLYSFTLFLARPTSPDMLSWLLSLVPTLALLRLIGVWGGSPSTLEMNRSIWMDEA